MNFLTLLDSIVNTLGPTVLLPTFIFIFAVILGAKAGRAFRAAVTIAVAFIGINLVIAWRIMLMTLLGRETPELPAEILFSDVELRTLHAYAKKKIKTTFVIG